MTDLSPSNAEPALPARKLTPAKTEPVSADEGSPVIRRLVLWIVYRSLRWLYRDVRLFGEELVPESGATLFVGNHPNDLPDVLQGFFVTRRPLRYIATISAASSWPARKIYEGLGVIPVVRVRDARAERKKGTDMVAVNAAAGQALGAALAAGHAVGVFPEGGVHNTPYTGRPRTGVAKMILEYIDNGAKDDVIIVPFGVQYEAPHRPGSDCFVRIGQPFSIRDWCRANVKNGDAASGAVAALASNFHSALLAITRNASSWQQAAARDRLIAAVAATISTEDALRASVGVVESAERLVESIPTLGDSPVVRMQTIANGLSGAVESAGGLGTSARDHADMKRALHGQAVPDTSLSAVAVRAPVAAAGWLIHGPVFAVVWWVARRFAKAPVDLMALALVPGVYIVSFWYLALTMGLAVGLSAAGASPWWCLLLPLSGPRLGDAAVAWRARWRRWRLVRRVHGWPETDRVRLADDYRLLTALWAEWETGRNTGPETAEDRNRGRVD